MAPYEALPRELFQSLSAEFHAQLTGRLDEFASLDFCYAGYVSACLVRIAWLQQLRKHYGDDDLYPVQIETNAQYCASLFGKEAALDFLSSTRWPFTVLDLEVHMRDCPDASFSSRLAVSLPEGVETFSRFITRALQPPGPTARLSSSSVDPQGISRRSGIRHVSGLKQRVIVASIDGGHCALWLELAFTLRALFPEHVSTRLVSFKGGQECEKQLGSDTFSGQEVFLFQNYYAGVWPLHSAHILVCQWIGECAKLRAFYSKPVLAYVGFLPLNDPSVGTYHVWSEPLAQYWERFQMLLDCDVHGGDRGSSRDVPLDGGPPCAVVWEEPQLAEAAHWQTGARLPSVRPLSLYVKATHQPTSGDQRVLVINRGRLVRDITFTEAANAFRHHDFPFTFVDQRAGMPYAEMAEHRAAVLQPWDLNLVMFHDLYAMELPLFLPDRAGLHHVAFSYFSRFRKHMDGEQPWSEIRPGRGESPHPYSPFQLEYLEAREYWLGFTEYVRAPHVGRFASLPDLLHRVARLDGVAIASAMRIHNKRCWRESRKFWMRALAAFERGSSNPPPRQTTPVLHFTTKYGRDLCWKMGLSREICCDSSYGPGGNPACFDDFWTYSRCCEYTLRLPQLNDSSCPSLVSSGVSPLDGRPWIQETPSVAEPFVFLWDEKCGGTTFMTWLKHSVWKLDKLYSSFMYTTPGHPVAIGTPFFLKSVSEEKRHSLEVVAGQFDWRVMHEGIGCQTRKKPRCFVLVRNPVDRFISYYLERSHRRFEREVAGNRSIEDWTPAELRQYLDSVRRDSMSYTGEETGLFCNFENLLCIDRLKTSNSQHPLLRNVRPSAAKERLYFRYFGGPQDRLAWMLDPERGDPKLGVWRMRRCTVGLQAEDSVGYRRVLGWHFPWIREVRRRPRNESHQDAAIVLNETRASHRKGDETVAEGDWGRNNPKSRTVRKRLKPFARAMIADFNARDMHIYRAARRQFRRQLQKIADASEGQQPRMPEVDYASEEEVQDTVSRELQDTATYQIHDRLNRYMLGL
eukprot:TRINITY_DN54553_c0_g1_i1.p1 TRINITY_DN54553_c0_g1~~TRINITY_DN54553_c0_g1_i1.p1  ORF type:complete len:1204 (-),score=156.88 TRINITY_DN54553_c0_g1_i1:33-3110(-)